MMDLEKDLSHKEDESTDKLINRLKKDEDFWNETIQNLTIKLNCSAKETVTIQAEVISNYQRLVDQIKEVSYVLYKLMPKIKNFRKLKFEYYSSNQVPYTVNAAQTMKLIEWDSALLDYQKDILDNHLEFLKLSLKNIDNMNYTIKNKISLYQMTDLD